MPCICQEASSKEVAADAEISDDSSSEAVHAGGGPEVKLQPAVGQISGIHRDGRLDVLWADGTRSLTYVQQLYVIADEVFQLDTQNILPYRLGQAFYCLALRPPAGPVRIPVLTQRLLKPSAGFFLQT